ncbi:UvrD-helicase domain-containing protein [Actinomadura parmotrematis]|uniref:DNA 3'-5' helicase n=1 Tax=Actinomadura parmotrematis TaxID=2864039 RepID=A0ABS7FYQ4_9ACTN|nr:UvrD-helicase domain-containing protein [Actinomadura parmotrematis]MBW8485570.1 AAA family ATPase [Actinomadura parmotrematis]
MAQLAIASSFMPQYARLDPRVRRGVEEAFAKFAQATHAGLHLEKIAGARDPNVRTIRIDLDRRGVVLAPERGDVYCLLAVLSHDAAIDYARSRRFTVNQAIGVLEVRDQEALETLEPALREMSRDVEQRLFAHVPDKHLRQLGVDAEIVPLVRLLTSDEHLQALESLLPEPQYIALLALAQGLPVEQAWNEVAACQDERAAPAEIDPGDLVAAMRRSPDKVVFVDGPEELRDVLAHPFATWRVFLHPVQRRMALRPSYSGPAQVTGGAGTGKTVTALHRARHLAASRPGSRVLFTTFTKSLARALQQQIDLLVDDPDVRGRIDVRTVDSLAYAVVGRHRKPEIVSPDVLTVLWDDAAAGTPFSPAFLRREWEQIVLAQHLAGEAEYLACTRQGRGVPLNTAQRSVVWKAVAAVEASLRERGERTFHQLANEAADLLAGPEYDHVVVDEAQDLHTAQWRLLRRIVPDGPDDLFIVGDPHQRIYDSHVSLTSLGIGVRGRSRKLKINYRTTQEILNWAVPILGRDPAQGMDDSADTLDGYRSPMHGRRPAVRACADERAELDELVEQVRRWVDAGVEPGAIGVAARYTWLARKAVKALRDAGVPAGSVGAAAGVQVGSMHTMKGMEFRCVAVIGAMDGTVPLRDVLTPEDEDARAYLQDLQRERCLLFVACTRARDHLYVSYHGAPSTLLPAV